MGGFLLPGLVCVSNLFQLCAVTAYKVSAARSDNIPRAVPV